MVRRAPDGEGCGVAGTDLPAVAQDVGGFPRRGVRGRSAARSRPLRITPAGVVRRSPSGSACGSGEVVDAARPEAPAAKAAATATATAPAIPSGCACVTSEASTACAAASSGSRRNHAPSGAHAHRRPVAQAPLPAEQGPRVRRPVPRILAELRQQLVHPAPEVPVGIGGVHVRERDRQVLLLDRSLMRQDAHQRQRHRRVVGPVPRLVAGRRAVGTISIALAAGGRTSVPRSRPRAPSPAGWRRRRRHPLCRARQTCAQGTCAEHTGPVDYAAQDFTPEQIERARAYKRDVRPLRLASPSSASPSRWS